MAEFSTYSPEDIINANLREMRLRLDGICEAELAHLSELAQELVSVLEENAAFSEILPDHLPIPPKDSPMQVLAQNTPAVDSFRALHYTWQKAWLCMEIYRLLSAKKQLSPSLFFPDSEMIPPNAYNRIVYQRSSYADSAYLKFAPLLTVSRASYAHSFPSACEDVYNGLCEFCILPLENSAEGLLSTFFRLIERYDLKIAATCDISGADHSRTSRFALLRRNLTPVLDPKQKELYFSFCVDAGGRPTVSELLLAAELYQIEIYRMDSFSKREGKEIPSVRLTLRTDAERLYAYLLYLAMEMPHCNPIGFYFHLPFDSEHL